METVITSLRSVVGSPAFYDAQGALNYGVVMEYCFACILVLLVVSSVFKLIVRWFE